MIYFTEKILQFKSLKIYKNCTYIKKITSGVKVLIVTLNYKIDKNFIKKFKI